MLFNSLEFLIFLPIIFIIFWAVPNRWRWIPLLAASYYFYVFWSFKLIFLILFTTVVSYVCASQDIRNGDFRQMKDRPLKNKPVETKPVFEEVVSDEDLPF